MHAKWRKHKQATTPRNRLLWFTVSRASNRPTLSENGGNSCAPAADASLGATAAAASQTARRAGRASRPPATGGAPWPSPAQLARPSPLTAPWPPPPAPPPMAPTIPRAHANAAPGTPGVAVPADADPSRRVAPAARLASAPTPTVAPVDLSPRAPAPRRWLLAEALPALPLTMAWTPWAPRLTG